MYRLLEYYRIGKYGKPIRALGTYASLEKARTAASVAYAEIQRIPESEPLFLMVVNTRDQIVYSVPEKPLEG